MQYILCIIVCNAYHSMICIPNIGMLSVSTKTYQFWDEYHTSFLTVRGQLRQISFSSSFFGTKWWFAGSNNGSRLSSLSSMTSKHFCTCRVQYCAGKLLFAISANETSASCRSPLLSIITCIFYQW